MIKKTVILGLIVCSFLICSTISVVAADGIIDDELDDVEDENFEIVSDAPNFDIDKVTYKRDGQAVTLKLSVNEKGVIENKGSLEIFRLDQDEEYLNEKMKEMEQWTEEEILEYWELLQAPFASYSFELKTEDNIYNISYVNEEYLIKDLYSTGDVQGNVDVDGNDLTVTFDLLDSGDRLVNLSVITGEFSDPELNLDEVAGDCVDAAASGSSSSSKTPGFEMITLLVAIAIAFIVLRRKKQ